MDEAPTWRSKRLIVTEHGIPYRGRPPRGQSHRRSRRSDDPPGGLGKPAVGRRVTGEPLEPDTATRNAERPKGEKRKLASRLLGNVHGRFWGGRMEKGRESGTSPAAYPICVISSASRPALSLFCKYLLADAFGSSIESEHVSRCLRVSAATPLLQGV